MAEEKEGTELSEEQREIAEAVAEAAGEAFRRAFADAGGALVVEVEAGGARPALERLRELGVSYLSTMHGIDMGEELAVMYHLFRPGTDFRVSVRVLCPRSRASVPSVNDLWHAAWWPEREIREMFGIEFEGQPDTRHLLLPDDWEGFPLRKDYEYPLEHPYLAPDPLHEKPERAVEVLERIKQARAGEGGNGSTEGPAESEGPQRRGGGGSAEDRADGGAAQCQGGEGEATGRAE